jgi:RNA recognition motif. (a.k.a. RRM, RBD, or RNP domain)
MRIFVGNLAWATTEEALSELFGPYGTVDRAQIATWRDNGRSRGFGFVEMPDATEAQAAIAGLNGMWTSRSMGTEMSGRDPMSIGKSNGLFHRLRAPILSPTLHHRVPSPGARAPMRSPGRPLAQLAAQSRKTQAAQTRASANGGMISTRLAGKIRCLQATGTQQVRQFPWTYAQEFGEPGCRDTQRLPLLVELGQSCFKSSPEPFCPFIGIALKHGSEHCFEVLRHTNRDKAHGSLLNIASEGGTNPEG